VNQHFIDNVWLDLTGLLDNFVEGLTGGLKVWVVRINDIDEGTTGLDVLVCIVLELVATWEIHNTKLYILIIVHQFSLNLGSWQKEESLVG
jgi:hypothetical protein